MRDPSTLERLGFMAHLGGSHTARTIMLDELATLFEQVPDDAPASVYQAAIRDHNCLAKRSGSTRKITARHLIALYGLDPSNPVHAGLRYFWSRDEKARPQLALLAAAARDSLLRDTLPEILALPPGTPITREWVEERIEQRWPERFSPATRKSVAQNINSSLTKSGHLQGRVKKIRHQLDPATGAVAFALYLGWLQGDRGELLLQNAYCRMLDAGPERLLELAGLASARGWLVMRRVDNVVDIDFPALAAIARSAIHDEPEKAKRRATR
jgi:hypothetical protein